MNGKANKIKFVPSPTESTDMEIYAGPSPKRRTLDTCSNFLSPTMNTEEFVLYSDGEGNNNRDDVQPICVCGDNDESMDTDNSGDGESKCICLVVTDRIKRFRVELFDVRQQLAAVYAENKRLKAQLKILSAQAGASAIRRFTS